MLSKTHLAIGVFATVFFLPHVNDKLIFVPIVLIASVLPDIDTGFSLMGKKWMFKPLQWFIKHRGVLHSFTVCIILSFLLALYFPVLALPFFLGYALHLLADSWTVEGIRPFWPHKAELKGKVRVNGVVEETIFITFAILDIIFIILIFI